MAKATLIEARNLRKVYPQKSFLGRAKDTLLPAVDDISLTIVRGETLGVVGESGCGKSTLGKMLTGLLPVSSGEIYFDGESIHDKNERQLIALRRRMQVVFQDPYSALNPYMTVRELVAEPLEIHHLAAKDELDTAVKALLDKVGLGQYDANRYPHQFSGGQRQRVCIARALAVRPEFVLCDEPVSALDVSIQSQIINLLLDLQAEMGLTYLFISHSFAVIRHIATRVAVMYLGRIVELAPVEAFFAGALHPYSRLLLAAVLTPDPKVKRPPLINLGEMTSRGAMSSGCAFYGRCPYGESICQTERPPLREIAPEHFCACHRAGVW